MSDNLKKQIAELIAPHLAEDEWADDVHYSLAACILALEPIAEALKMKPIQTMKVRD